MADTELLLGLVNEFPTAFGDPEAPKASPSPAPLTPESAKTTQLMALVAEFPQAFADPESAAPAVSSEAAAEAVAVPEANPAAPVTEPLVAEAPALPVGYRTALQRRVSTYTWGQVDCYLTYGETGLQQFWVTVGKSGTEVQSLCEAIARLVNLLLAQQVAVPVIVKQLRGIRGGTPEGLGPNTLLGLADLIGKVLQEAPQFGVTANVAPIASTTVEKGIEVEMMGEVETSIASAVSAVESSWVSLSDDLLEAALCPECGAQLQQMNGCSGGACAVCGYSSCS
jgi:hypothetical protein